MSLTITPSETSVTVEWGQVTGAGYYNIGYSTTSDGSNIIGSAVISEPTRTHTKSNNLVASTTYYVKVIPQDVSANTMAGDSGWVAFTTAAHVEKTCPVATITSPSAGVIRSAWTSLPNSSYNIRIYSDAGGTSLLTNRPWTNGSGSNQSSVDNYTIGTPGTYYVEVRPSGNTSACTIQSVTVS